MRNGFSKVRILDAEVTTDKQSGFEVFHVSTPSAFVQASGYLKHTVGQQHKRAIIFRGQRKLYPTLKPTLYRNVDKERVRRSRQNAINELLNKIELEGTVLRGVPRVAFEPLLQHYGINTQWIDAVDNVWVALWFACHEVETTGRRNEFVCFERRRADWPPSSERQFAYVLMLEAANFNSDATHPGYYYDSTSAMIDLRIVAPSQFVRPHAQHGLLIQSLQRDGNPNIDFIPMVAGVIRVDLKLALEWLGDSHMLTVHSLFPGPMFDIGYRQLLERVGGLGPTLGAIGVVVP